MCMHCVMKMTVLFHGTLILFMILNLKTFRFHFFASSSSVSVLTVCFARLLLATKFVRSIWSGLVVVPHAGNNFNVTFLSVLYHVFTPTMTFGSTAFAFRSTKYIYSYIIWTLWSARSFLETAMFILNGATRNTPHRMSYLCVYGRGLLFSNWWNICILFGCLMWECFEQTDSPNVFSEHQFCFFWRWNVRHVFECDQPSFVSSFFFFIIKKSSFISNEGFVSGSGSTEPTIISQRTVN